MQLKRELKQVLDSIDHAQVELAKWNGKIETLTGAYQQEQNKVQKLSEQLQRIQIDINDLNQYIVNDPNAIRVNNEAMKKQVRRRTKRMCKVFSEK